MKHTLQAAVAQSVERRIGSAEVTGPIPVSSFEVIEYKGFSKKFLFEKSLFFDDIIDKLQIYCFSNISEYSNASEPPFYRLRAI